MIRGSFGMDNLPMGNNPFPEDAKYLPAKYAENAKAMAHTGKTAESV